MDPNPKSSVRRTYIAGVTLSTLITDIYQQPPGSRCMYELFGHREKRVEATDYSESTEFTETIITSILPWKSEAAPQGTCFLGLASLRRNSAHKLSFSDTLFLNGGIQGSASDSTREPHASDGTTGKNTVTPALLLLLVTTRNANEQGTEKTEYTLFEQNARSEASSTEPQSNFSSASRPSILKLTVDNAVDSLSTFSRLGDVFVRNPPTEPPPRSKNAFALGKGEGKPPLQGATENAFNHGVSEIQRLSARQKALMDEVSQLQEAIKRRQGRAETSNHT